MKKKKNLVLIPGGFEEGSITQFNKDRIYIKCRKGFIKYAIKYGYTIYPVFTFNETKTYSTIDILLNFRVWLNKFKIPGTLYYGLYGYPLAPDYK